MESNETNSFLHSKGITVKRRIDEKHHVEFTISDGARWQDGKLQIVKTTNDQPIPDDEPIILFRARDYLAVPMLSYYKQLCNYDGATDYQLNSMEKMIQSFKDFARTHPEVMKQPGCTKGK